MKRLEEEFHNADRQVIEGEGGQYDYEERLEGEDWLAEQGGQGSPRAAARPRAPRRRAVAPGYGPQRGGVPGAVQRFVPPELRAAARNEVYARNDRPVESSTRFQFLASGDVAAPSAGRVHYVAMGPLGREPVHFLKEMDADSNMGAKKLRDSSRKGPFRTERGSSRVLSRTRHITYRRRGHALEITISRGVTAEEMDELVGKLAAHRVSTSGTMLWLIDSKSKKMGKLSQIDLIKLRDKVLETLSSRRTVGLRLLDKPGKHGAMLKESNHSHRMAQFSKQI